MRKLILKKCLECETMVHLIEDCSCKECEFVCCGKSMKELSSNSVDASFEKHVPSYEIIQGILTVKVNHVMTEDHYIEWICYVTDRSEEFVYFLPNEEACATFELKENGCLYAYCNLHGLWKQEVTML